MGRSCRLEPINPHRPFFPRSRSLGSPKINPFPFSHPVLHSHCSRPPPTVPRHLSISESNSRMTWSIKLSPHLHHVNEIEGGIFFMETLEVIRRWIWIAFRFEAEWSKLTHIGPETRRVRGNSIPVLEITKVKERSVSFTNPKA